MIDRNILDGIENEDLTQEDVAYLADKLCRLGKKSATAVVPRVIIFLRSRAKLGQVSREETAKHLNMSTRTLSRKLKKEHTGFHRLLDEERQRRCLHYLHGNISCGQEFAELLGLSDGSHFYRLFKQWTGHSFSAVKTMLAENNGDIGTIFHRHDGKVDR